MTKGIDYSGTSGTCNRDTETGIRYGIISVNAIDSQQWFDTAELDYGEPTCPECGNDAVEFTRAQFCSPCAPGACYLTNPCDDGARAYCLGHDWFESGIAPYPVYSVDRRNCSPERLTMTPIKLDHGTLHGKKLPPHLGRAWGRHVFRLLHTRLPARKPCLWLRDLPVSLGDLEREYGYSEPLEAYRAECDRANTPQDVRVF